MVGTENSKSSSPKVCRKFVLYSRNNVPCNPVSTEICLFRKYGTDGNHSILTRYRRNAFFA